MKTTSHPIKATGRFAQTAVAGSAAAAGVFALQHQAEAAIVYSGIQNVVASVPGSIGGASANVDFDGGGPDWQLRAFATTNTGSLGRVSIQALAGKQAAILGGNLRKLASGNVISGGLAGWMTGFGLVRQAFYSTSYGGTGNWSLSNQTGFGAFRLNTGFGNYRYGWVRLKWTDSADINPHPNALIAVDWAYESTINAPIQAGNTGAPIPEPSRALLALAGAGAAFLRRRRKSD